MAKSISNRVALTASVFKAVDGVGQEADTPKESSSLLLVDLLVIPHADCDGIRLPDVSEEKNTSRATSLVFKGKQLCERCGHFVVGKKTQQCQWCSWAARPGTIFTGSPLPSSPRKHPIHKVNV